MENLTKDVVEGYMDSKNDDSYGFDYCFFAAQSKKYQIVHKDELDGRVYKTWSADSLNRSAFKKHPDSSLNKISLPNGADIDIFVLLNRIYHEGLSKDNVYRSTMYTLLEQLGWTVSARQYQALRSGLLRLSSFNLSSYYCDGDTRENIYAFGSFISFKMEESEGKSQVAIYFSNDFINYLQKQNIAVNKKIYAIIRNKFKPGPRYMYFVSRSLRRLATRDINGTLRYDIHHDELVKRMPNSSFSRGKVSRLADVLDFLSVIQIISGWSTTAHKNHLTLHYPGIDVAPYYDKVPSFVDFMLSYEDLGLDEPFEANQVEYIFNALRDENKWSDERIDMYVATALQGENGMIEHAKSLKKKKSFTRYYWAKALASGWKHYETKENKKKKALAPKERELQKAKKEYDDLSEQVNKKYAPNFINAFNRQQPDVREYCLDSYIYPTFTNTPYCKESKAQNRINVYAIGLACLISWVMYRPDAASKPIPAGFTAEKEGRALAENYDKLTEAKQQCDDLSYEIEKEGA